MIGNSLIVFYDKQIIVVINIPLGTILHKEMILDNYAKDYTFDRSKLTGMLSHSIDEPCLFEGLGPFLKGGKQNV